MKINRDAAMHAWLRQFGNVLTAEDFAGRKIAREDYGKAGSETGWNLDHICPVSRNGCSKSYNIICCHMDTNAEKGNDYPEFQANGKKFRVTGDIMNQTIKKVGDADRGVQVKETKCGKGKTDFYNISEAREFWEKSLTMEEPQSMREVKVIVEANSMKREEENAVFRCLAELFSPMRVFATEKSFEERNSIYYSFSIIDMDNEVDTEDCIKKCQLLEFYSAYFSSKYHWNVAIEYGDFHRDPVLGLYELIA